MCVLWIFTYKFDYCNRQDLRLELYLWIHVCFIYALPAKAILLIHLVLLARWCGPCQILGPRLEKAIAKQKGRVAMAKVDIDDHTDLAIEYGVNSSVIVLLIPFISWISPWLVLQLFNSQCVALSPGVCCTNGNCNARRWRRWPVCRDQRWRWTGLICQQDHWTVILLSPT